MHGNGNGLTVVLVHRNDVERTQIRQALESVPGVQIAGERSDLRSGMALAHQVRPTLLVLELTGTGEEALSVASQYRLDDPDVTIFVSTEAAVNPDMLLKAMRAGVQEVLRRPLDRPALTEALERIAALSARKHGGSTQHPVITVFSNKGGVGVTTIATNLALCLRRHSRRETALVDFDYQSGDVASMVGLPAERSIGDLLLVDRLDSAAVQSALMKHGSGLMVLAQPEHIDQADGLTAHQTGSMLEIVRSMHDFVVVDAPHLFNDIALEIFDRSSQIFVVVELSIPSVRAARRSLDLFHSLNYLTVPDRVRLIVNRRVEKAAIAPAQVQETLGMPIAFSVANDYAAVSQSINLGHPLCAEPPTSRAGRDIDAIARALAATEDSATAEPVPARKRRGLFGRG